MKSTALSTDLPLLQPRLGEKLNSSDLSRYPEQMMQGLAAAILCRAGPVLEALRPGGMAPHANPTTPPRRPREPSPSTPGDNKRQSRRLKAGQQALAGLTLGSLPVSASDTPAAGTSTQRTGEVEGFWGETLPLDPWAHQGMEISDRPTILPITHDPNISDKVMYLQMAFKQRPLRDGGGKPSLGRCPKQQCWGPGSVSSLRHGGTSSRSRSCWGRGHIPSWRTYWRTSGRSSGRPTLFSGHLAQRGSEHSEQGVLLGVTDPPLTSPGIWPLKKELKGEEPEFQELPHPTGRVTTPRRITSASSSGAHFWRRSSVRRRQHPDVAAPARTFVPAPWRASTRGTRSARSTMARWEGPMTPSGTRRWRGRRLRRCWMGSKLSIGYMRQPRRDPPLRVPLAPRGGSSNLHLGAGSGRSRAPGGCCSRRTSPRPTGE